LRRSGWPFQRTKKPTWQNTLRHSTTSAYSLTGLRPADYPLSSLPNTSQRLSIPENSPNGLTVSNGVSHYERQRTEPAHPRPWPGDLQCANSSSHVRFDGPQDGMGSICSPTLVPDHIKKPSVDGATCEGKMAKHRSPRKRMTFRHYYMCQKRGGLLACVTRQRLDGTFSAARPCRTHQPAAAITSIINVVGSGTTAFALSPAPLPAVWPKWARQALNPA
jgi:hypothetical protein